jgi:DegV family protein with EDD domain
VADYLIYTDSTADLSQGLIDELGLGIIPFQFVIDGREYFDYPDRREMPIEDFYALLRAGKQATTSLVNTERYLKAFEPELKAGRDILYVAFSSGLSGSVTCAAEAAGILTEKYPGRRLAVVDTLAASMGQGLMAYLAVRQKEAGMSIDELAGWLEDAVPRLCMWFTVDDLGHLRRGGRVSRAAAVLGSMLNIKPVLHVNDAGKLIPMLKVRGRKSSLKNLMERLEKTGTDIKNQTIMISHGDCEGECLGLAGEIKRCLGVKEIYVNPIGPVIGAHAGPGTIALFFIGTER